MITNFYRAIKFSLAVSIGLSILVGCAAPEVQLKPWDNNTLSQVQFTFNDTDMDKGEVAGEISLDIPASLKPANITNYVVYWSSSSNQSGKGSKLAEVSAQFSGTTLFRVPENTAIPTTAGEYFLLYLKGSSGEVSSGKSTQVSDKFILDGEVQESAKAPEAKPEAKPEEVAGDVSEEQEQPAAAAAGEEEEKSE